jgi:hypothetical protein
MRKEVSCIIGRDALGVKAGAQGIIIEGLTPMRSTKIFIICFVQLRGTAFEGAILFWVSCEGLNTHLLVEPFFDEAFRCSDYRYMRFGSLKDGLTICHCLCLKMTERAFYLKNSF